jgi:hypothetical protein
MSTDSIPPDASYANLDAIIAAISDADTEEERRLYHRAAVRNLEILAGNLQVRLGAIADALTPKRVR